VQDLRYLVTNPETGPISGTSSKSSEKPPSRDGPTIILLMADPFEQVFRQKTRLENVEAELESMKAAFRKLSEADEKAEKLKILRK